MVFQFRNAPVERDLSRPARPWNLEQHVVSVFPPAPCRVVGDRQAAAVPVSGAARLSEAAPAGACPAAVIPQSCRCRRGPSYTSESAVRLLRVPVMAVARAAGGLQPAVSGDDASSSSGGYRGQCLLPPGAVRSH